jgi:hypothetical protein
MIFLSVGVQLSENVMLIAAKQVELFFKTAQLIGIILVDIKFWQLAKGTKPGVTPTHIDSTYKPSSHEV